MEKGDFLSLGRSSPESSGSVSPIKAIRVSHDQVKENGELLAPLSDSVGWPSAWNENEFDKARNACQRRKVGVLLTENRQLTKDRKAAVRALHLTEEKLTSKTAESLRLREVNALVLERLRQSGGSRQAELRIQENKLRMEFDEAMQRVRDDLCRKHNQERQAAVKQERCEAERRVANRVSAVEGLVREREVELDETKKELAEVKGSLEERICKQRDELQKLEEEQVAMEKELKKCKEEKSGKQGKVRGGTNTHVMLILVQPEEHDEKSEQMSSNHNFVESPFSVEKNACLEGMDENELIDVEEEIEGNESTESEEEISTRSGNCEVECKGLTTPIKQEKARVVEQTEFARPIPSGILWADLLDTDDARWYAESTVDGDAGEEDFLETESEDSLEEEEEDNEGKGGHGGDGKRELEEKEQGGGGGGGGNVEGYEEPSWWCKNEQGSFRAFSHFRDPAYDGGSRQSSIRTVRRSYDSPPQSPRFMSSKASTPTTDSSREWGSHSQDKNSDGQNVWSEWSNKGGSREFGNIQKVSPGVLVVERRPNFGNTALMPPRRSQSDVPQCRRWLAGYCRFQDRCWFRHE
ncbi:hypothetical protein BSKO_11858 [Bryopsis sp. KO-2023]|nr:hypothetical protein BSKO_11858 [Bryopsis sp. KO-2023]